MDVSIRKLLEENKDMKAIDFYSKLYSEYASGVLFSFPIDDSALCAFDITVGDLLEYMKPGQERVHWSEILEKLLIKKGILEA